MGFKSAAAFEKKKRKSGSQRRVIIILWRKILARIQRAIKSLCCSSLQRLVWTLRRGTRGEVWRNSCMWGAGQWIIYTNLAFNVVHVHWTICPPGRKEGSRAFKHQFLSLDVTASALVPSRLSSQIWIHSGSEAKDCRFLFMGRKKSAGRCPPLSRCSPVSSSRVLFSINPRDGCQTAGRSSV